MWTCPKPTILKLLVDLGTACAEFHNERVRNLHAQRIQCDNFARIHGTLRVTPAMRPALQITCGVSKNWSGCWTEPVLKPRNDLL